MSDTTSPEPKVYPTPASDRLDAKAEFFDSVRDGVIANEAERLRHLNRAKLMDEALKYFDHVDIKRATMKEMVAEVADQIWHTHETFAEREAMRLEYSKEARLLADVAGWEAMVPAAYAALQAKIETPEKAYCHPQFLMDAALHIANAKQRAYYWRQVEYAILEGHEEPLKAAEGVAQYAIKALLQGAARGAFRSSSMTANLEAEAELMGTTAFVSTMGRYVDSLKDFGRGY